MRAVGQDMDVARDAGIKVERTRIIAIVLSTVCAGIGMAVSYTHLDVYKRQAYTVAAQIVYRDQLTIVSITSGRAEDEAWAIDLIRKVEVVG